MANDNPNDMSNMDLEKDAADNKSTAAEGTLKQPWQDEHSRSQILNNNNPDDERDLDDLSHKDDIDDKVHNGNLPDPEDIDHWETDDEDGNKISG